MYHLGIQPEFPSSSTFEMQTQKEAEVTSNHCQDLKITTIIFGSGL